jgi:hypothetical protein
MYFQPAPPLWRVPPSIRARCPESPLLHETRSAHFRFFYWKWLAVPSSLQRLGLETVETGSGGDGVRPSILAILIDDAPVPVYSARYHGTKTTDRDRGRTLSHYHAGQRPPCDISFRRGPCKVSFTTGRSEGAAAILSVCLLPDDQPRSPTDRTTGGYDRADHA